MSKRNIQKFSFRRSNRASEKQETRLYEILTVSAPFLPLNADRTSKRSLPLPYHSKKKCETRFSARGAFFSSVKELFHLSFLPSVKRFSEARIFLRRRCRTDGNFPLPSEKLKRTGSDPVRFTVDRDLYSNMISREPRLFSPASLTPIAPGSVSC